MSTTPPFDPRAVPARPVVDVRFDTDSEGREIAVVDGLPIRRAPHETARESAFRTVADLVDRIASVDESGRRSPAVRARVHGPQGTSQIFVVHRERRVFMPTAGGARVTDQPGVASPAAPSPRVAAQPGTDPSGAEGTNRWPGTAAVAVTGAPRKAAPAAWTPTSADAARPPQGRGSRRPSTPSGWSDASSPVAAGVSRVGTAAGPVAPSAPSNPKAAPAAPTAWAYRPDSEPRAASLSFAATPTAPPRPSTPAPSPTPTRGTRRAQSPSDDRPDPGATLLRTARAGRGAPSGATSPKRRPGSATAQRRLRPVAPTLMAAAVVVAVGAGAVAWSVQRTSATPPGVAARAALGAPTLPTAAPAGWQRTPRWVTPPLLPAAGATVVVDDAVVYVTLERRLTVVDAMSGQPRWSADLPAGDVRAAPARTRMRGSDVIAMHVGDHLLAWRVSDGAAQTPLPLPTGAAVTYLGSAPLVGLRADTVGVVRDERVAEVKVPGGATPLAASADGTVTAASPAGWWHLRADVAAPLPTPWESALPGAGEVRPTVVGYVGSSIVTLEAADATGRPHVVVHTDRPADVRVSFRGALAGPAKGLRWSRSPSNTWGVLGRTLVDVRAGSVTDLGAWSTTWVAHDRAYGTIGGTPVVAGPEVARGVLPGGAPPVEAMSRAGGAVRVADGSGQRVYFLPPTQ